MHLYAIVRVLNALNARDDVLYDVHPNAVEHRHIPRHIERQKGLNTMTVTELAKQLGVSKGTIYNKLKAAGIELSSLRDGGGTDLSNSGIQVISSMFDHVSADQPAGPNEEKHVVPDITPEPNMLIEIAVLKERIAALERENDMLRASVEDWKEQAKSSTRLLTGYVEKPSWIARLFGKKDV